MKPAAIEAVVAAAKGSGMLPHDAVAPSAAGRPWPLVLLTALGAWLAALPLLLAFAMLFGNSLFDGIGGALFGAVMLAGAVVVLRAEGVPHFMEQMTIPALFTGIGLIAWRLFEGLPHALTEVVLMGLVLAVAAAVPRVWLRQLLGATAVPLLVLAIGGGSFDPGNWSTSFGWYAALAAWVGAQRVLGPVGAGATRPAIVLEAVAGGWACALLAGLALSSGVTMFVGAGYDARLVEAMNSSFDRRAPSLLLAGLSVASCALVGGWIARCWPGFRTPVFGGVVLVLAVLCGFMPLLGATLAVFAVALTSRRPALSAAAAVAALWIVGAFYYRLHWPLAQKALLLVGAGLVLGLLCRLALTRRTPSHAQLGRGGWTAAGGIALSVAATLAVVNLGIRDKEALIAGGRPVFIELRPADPRSLLQGDYMRLDFRMPVEVEGGFGELSGAQRPKVVATIDARGVAEVRRRDNGEPLAADEIRLELTQKGGAWIIVSDAWFFREGEAAKWQAAKYGEFRVAADGRALLVGLADGALRGIR